MNRILLVEDDRAIARNLVLLLRAEGFEVVHAPTRAQALDQTARGAFDLALVDISLPDGNGFSLLTEMREKQDVPVIFLTASGDEASVVTGLSLGADDYVTKPFSPSELVARVDALYRRVAMAAEKAAAPAPNEIKSGPFVLNTKSRTVSKNGKILELTQVEYQILEYFFNNPNTALGRQDILNKVWGEGYFGDVKIVDVNIRRLRMKLEDKPSEPEFLLTVWGFGYKWVQK